MKSSTFTKAIENESEYLAASKLLAQKKRPPAVLRLLMNSFESYRQARKFGWSRPWNKVNLMNFQSFKFKISQQSYLLQIAQQLLQQSHSDIPQEAHDFCNNLLNDDKLMSFIFVHEYDDNGQKFEGATLSLGRKNDKRYRDRLDIIIESPIIDGLSQGVQRCRIFIDPYKKDNKNPLWQGTIDIKDNAYIDDLFSALSHISWLWAHQSEYIWDHWTSAYIDYFGPRQWSLSKSYFYLNADQKQRIQLDLPSSIIEEITVNE